MDYRFFFPETTINARKIARLSCGIGWQLYSLRASSPVWGSEASLARTREGGAEERRACNDLSKISFPPRKPQDSAKRENCYRKVPQIRKVTTACQVSLNSRGRVELLICKSLSQQYQSNVFNHWYVFFTGTSNFDVSARIRTHYFDSRFVYFWKVVHTAV